MKELADILHAHAEMPPGSEAALATVVRVSGSAYRASGAKLLVIGSRMIGQVSGGCLERDVVQRAGGVVASKQPQLVRYETSNDPDNGTAYTLGCGGAIDILIEPLNTPAGSDLMRSLANSRTTPTVIATVLSKRHPRFALGDHVMMDATGVIAGASSNLPDAVLEKCRAVLATGRSASAVISHADGPLEIFFDLLNPPLQLLVFGAGNDALPLVNLGHLLGWKVTVVDVGSSSPDPDRVWHVDRFIKCPVAQLADQLTISPHSAAVVMTHNFKHDQQILRFLSTQPLQYLGMLGPRHRTDQLLGELKIESLRAPVGLDIGAETPEEVALAIAAEITAVLRGGGGAALSNKAGPIHTRGI